MKDKKVLTVQDISCFGQCSLTVALPIISACGIETAILPSAVLSTHTGGFKGFTFRDLSDDIPAIQKQWLTEGLKFDSIYTGYLGSKKQIDMVADLMDTLLEEDGLRIVDPAMADNGKLYTGFDMAYVEEMKRLAKRADIFLPNLTEACLLTGYDFRTDRAEDSSSGKVQDEAYIDEVVQALGQLCGGKVILKGLMYKPGQLGVCIYDPKTGQKQYVFNDRINKSFHGTGDCYASALTGMLMRGKSEEEACAIAGQFVLTAIKETIKDPNHWYGVKFEKALKVLV